MQILIKINEQPPRYAKTGEQTNELAEGWTNRCTKGGDYLGHLWINRGQKLKIIILGRVEVTSEIFLDE